MKVQVTVNNVRIIEPSILNENEYNIHECEFEFVEEYNGLSKKAIFTNEAGADYIVSIVNDKCSIPSEVLKEKEFVKLGVYAYDIENEELVLRYSPKPTEFYVQEGSYKNAGGTPPTPSEIEQLQSQITQNSNDINVLEGNILNLQEEQVEQNRNIQANADDIEEIKAEQITQNTNIQKNTDDIVNINQAIDTINTDITNIDSAIGNINEDIDNLEQDLTNYSLITETGSQINLNINNTNYQITAILKDKNGNVIYTSNVIDLPIESMIVNARYDNTTKEIVLTLQNGNTLRISVADLISGLVSETQLQTILANYYNKTEIDNLLSNLAERVSTNEEDIADIKEEQTTQNTNIEELQNQVETLQEDLESANAEIEELNTDITNMRKAMITVDGQGSDITLENTSENKLVEFGLEGRTEQTQYEGYNLCSTFAIRNNVEVAFNFDKNLLEKTFTLSFITNENLNVNSVYLDKGQGGSSRIGTISGSGNTRVSTTITLLDDVFADLKNSGWYNLRVYKGDGNFTKLIQGQIENGSNLKPYEPYVGGQAIPSSSYPQPIKNVTGQANVKIQNKNLFDGELELGIYSGSTGAKSPNNSYIRSVNYIEVDELSDYKFSLSNGNGISLYIYEYKKDFSYNQSASKLVNSSSHLVTNKDTKYITFRTYNENTDINTKIQLEQGTTATSYVPHAEQNYPFTFAEGQRAMQGTQLLDDGIHQNRNQVVLDGTENFVEHSIVFNNIKGFRLTINNLKPAINDTSLANIKCNIAIEETFATYNSNSRSYSKITSLKSTNNYMYFTQPNASIDTVEKFKAYLAERYSNGTPLIIEIPLAEEEKIPYNETQQVQYNNIKANASSHDGITIMSSESDELGFNMNVVAVADANKVIDNQNSEIDTIKSRLDLLEG